MTGPVIGGNVDEPVDGLVEHTARLIGVDPAAARAQVTRERLGAEPAQLGTASHRLVEQTAPEPMRLYTADGREAAVQADARRGFVTLPSSSPYPGGGYELPLPDSIDPDGRARWHGPQLARNGPGYFVARETDGRVYADPGHPIFGPYDRDVARAFGMAVLAACGSAPTSVRSDRA